MLKTYTFQNTESKSAPLNLSGIPAAESFGPSNVTNSSKPTWPSPDKTNSNTNITSVSRLCVGLYAAYPLMNLLNQRERETLTIHIKSLDDNLQLHLIGHVTQRAHGHPQLLLWDEPIPISVKHFESLTNLCWKMAIIVLWTTSMFILIYHWRFHNVGNGWQAQLNILIWNMRAHIV